MARPDRTHIVRRVISLLDREAHDPAICLKRVSQSIGCSESDVSRLLMKHTGRGFRDHLRSRRVARAKELLADRALSLKEIANHVGFANASQFTRQFAGSVGITPSHYRKLLATELAS